jgi:hypothetical protein
MKAPRLSAVASAGFRGTPESRSRKGTDRLNESMGQSNFSASALSALSGFTAQGNPTDFNIGKSVTESE